LRSIKELMDLKNRVALVTGSGGHIGFAIAQAFAEAGADIVLLDIDKKSCAANANRLAQDYGVDTLCLNIDLSNEKKIRAIPKIIAAEFQYLHILVNCAALVGTSKLKGWAVPFERQSVATWRKALEINLTSVFALSQACSKLLAVSGHGAIINISSIAGITAPDMRLYEGTGLGNPAAYSVSKAGIIQLSRWLATTLAPDIRVNAISPGGVFRGHKEPFLSRYIQRTPLRRMASEEDLKGAALYLASDLSGYVTGHNLVVDGGWSVW